MSLTARNILQHLSCVEDSEAARKAVIQRLPRNGQRRRYRHRRKQEDIFHPTCTSNSTTLTQDAGESSKKINQRGDQKKIRATDESGTVPEVWVSKRLDSCKNGPNPIQPLMGDITHHGEAVTTNEEVTPETPQANTSVKFVPGPRTPNREPDNESAPMLNFNRDIKSTKQALEGAERASGGATYYIKGPAKHQIKTDWRARLESNSLTSLMTISLSPQSLDTFDPPPPYRQSPCGGTVAEGGLTPPPMGLEDAKTEMFQALSLKRSSKSTGSKKLQTIKWAMVSVPNEGIIPMPARQIEGWKTASLGDHVDYVFCNARDSGLFMGMTVKSEFGKKMMTEYDRSFCGYIRPTLEYASPCWSTALTQKQSDALERVQKRACRIILGQEQLCGQSSRFRSWLPPTRGEQHGRNLRNATRYRQPPGTKRYTTSGIPALDLSNTNMDEPRTCVSRIKENRFSAILLKDVIGYDSFGRKQQNVVTTAMWRVGDFVKARTFIRHIGKDSHSELAHPDGRVTCYFRMAGNQNAFRGTFDNAKRAGRPRPDEVTEALEPPRANTHRRGGPAQSTSLIEGADNTTSPTPGARGAPPPQRTADTGTRQTF
ncbi:hypothetical protein Bbelb_318100 [Branchiostoma belcheri]|nr:hypothetical protein Bbelb_318100 [Branchiostoma belcheri]